MNTEMEGEEVLDAVILGASGFTGKYVVREFLSHLERPDGQGLRRIGIAGRNREKLGETLRWAAQGALPPSIPIIEADVTDAASMAALCRRTRLILSCVGPYRLYGEPVVAACVEAGVDYLDITGEPEFMERMEAIYHESALLSGSLVISACGYDSVPAELGVIFHARQWEPPSVPHSVDAYLVLESDKQIVGNITTFESAVLGVANADELHKLRRSRPRRPKLQVPGPPASKAKSIEHQKSIGLWALKLPSSDAAVVRRTQALLAENPHGLPAVNENSELVETRRKFWSEVKPLYFGVYLGSKSFWSIPRTICIGLMVVLLGRFSWGRSLLLKYPEIFTLGQFKKRGPTEEEVRSASFKMWFLGHGFSDESHLLQQGSKPNMEMVTRISGPEIGYATTPITLVQCALLVMDQRQSLPKGGVLPPGIVFGPTDLQERLEKRGILFELISKKTIS
uniref:Saccharopine dehydrogenase n=1 Tax=Juniperus convallium var. microsperma TaxID=2773310 RepID=A0A3Q8CJT0_9CONI|nr:saccharopine dehydrogenase [Juniperus microsperma]